MSSCRNQGYEFHISGVTSKHILENDLPVDVTKVHAEIDYTVVSMKWSAMGIKIDSLADKQKVDMGS